MRKGVGDEAPPIDIMSSRCSSENSPRSSRCTVVDDISRGASQYEARVCLEVDLLSDHAELYAGIDRTIDRCVPEVRFSSQHALWERTPASWFVFARIGTTRLR